MVIRLIPTYVYVVHGSSYKIHFEGTTNFTNRIYRMKRNRKEISSNRTQKIINQRKKFGKTL
jgi:hypothetical protein